MNFNVDVNIRAVGAKQINDIEQQIKSLQNKTVDVRFNATGMEDITKMFSSSGISNKARQAGEQVGKSYATALQKQINSIAKTQKSPFDTQLRNITKQQMKYSDWWNKELSKASNIDYGKDRQSAAFDAYMRQIESRAKKAQEIQKRVSQGFLDVEVSGLKKNIGKYSGIDSDYLREAEASLKKLSSLQKELKTGISDDGLERTLSDKDIVSKYNSYLDVLEKAQNQAKVLNNEISKISKPFNQLDAETASNKTLTWLKNNTKAANEFGETLTQIAAKQKAATNADELAQYNKEFRNVVSEANLKGLTGRSSLAEFKRAFGQIAEFATAYGLIQNVVYEVPRQIAQAVKDINAAQIELTKVADASPGQLSQYWEEAAVSAEHYGASISDVINSTADWSRLGYGLEEAKELSNATTLIQRVGDNMTQQTSSEGLVSTLQGFRLEADEVMRVIDEINEVANTQPIDTAGIFAGLQRSASSMSAANNTLEETIALITAGNSVMQDPERVGNGLKTISMRIRGATTELEAAGESTDGMATSTASLRKEVMALSGIDIMQDETTFKSTYDILDELSTKWSDLTDIQQASLTELLAGKKCLPEYTEMCA